MFIFEFLGNLVRAAVSVVSWSIDAFFSLASGVASFLFYPVTQAAGFLADHGPVWMNSYQWMPLVVIALVLIFVALLACFVAAAAIRHKKQHR